MSEQWLYDSAKFGARIVVGLSLGDIPYRSTGYLVGVDDDYLMLVMLGENDDILDEPMLTILPKAAIQLIVLAKDGAYENEPEAVKAFINPYLQTYLTERE